MSLMFDGQQRHPRMPAEPGRLRVITMLAELAKLEGVFGCLKVSKEPKVSQVLEVPDESNGLFGAWRVLKELKVSPDTTGTFDVPHV